MGDQDLVEVLLQALSLLLKLSQFSYGIKGNLLKVHVAVIDLNDKVLDGLLRLSRYI